MEAIKYFASSEADFMYRLDTQSEQCLALALKEGTDKEGFPFSVAQVQEYHYAPEHLIYMVENYKVITEADFFERMKKLRHAQLKILSQYEPQA